MNIRDLNPTNVWTIFEQILAIPRPSGHEEKIAAWIEDFAEKHNLKHSHDMTGNVVVNVPATKGFENRPTLALQAHMDMVCEKISSSQHNFLSEPINAYVDGDRVRARGTTLGADDGIGIAAALAVAIDKNISHGPIECLFTVDEERGLTGAKGLLPNMLHASTLLNLDSEEEGILYIGCAGGATTTATFTVDSEPSHDDVLPLSITISGLTGGHSGGDIHLGRANAIKIAARLVDTLARQCNFRLSHFEGGGLHNAIPREAIIKGVVPFDEREQVRIAFNLESADIQSECSNTDPNMSLALETTDQPLKLFTVDFQRRFIGSLIACPHGVMAMDSQIQGLVETSNNLASVKNDNGKIVVTTSQRSSVDASLTYATQICAATFGLARANVATSDGYPGWTPNVNSPILSIAKQTYCTLFAKEPIVTAIHAGLECGLIGQIYPDCDMLSFGPSLFDVHTPSESIVIDSVERFYRHLVAIVEAYSAQ